VLHLHVINSGLTFLVDGQRDPFIEKELRPELGRPACTLPHFADAPRPAE